MDDRELETYPFPHHAVEDQDEGVDLTGNEPLPAMVNRYKSPSRAQLNTLSQYDEKKKLFPVVRTDAEMLTQIAPTREIKRNSIHQPRVSYNFTHPRRGFAVIINQENFHATTGQEKREGSEVDARLLSEQFLAMGFDVGRYDDLTGLEMKQLVQDLSKMDYSDCDCFIFAIMSHGTRGRVFAYDHALTIRSLLAPFKGENCVSLIGKPKLFFVQACRGIRFMHGVALPTMDEGEDEPDHAVVDECDLNKTTIPSEADVFIAYSVTPGYFAWRNNVDGSWFVRALVHVLKECGDSMELLEMMTYVNRIIAYDYASCTDNDFTDGMKQVPSVVSRLTKSVYFTPKHTADAFNVYSHYPSQYQHSTARHELPKM